MTSASLFEDEAPGMLRLSTARRGISPARAIEQGLALPLENKPLHYTRHLTALCADICARVPELRHVDMQRVLVTLVRCRNANRWGYQAKLTPLRFRGGSLQELRRGHMYQVQRFYVDEIELHYVLSFYVPRFLNQCFDEKLVTVFHELFHIGPEFHGDIRRFAGPNPIHDRSQRDYDRKMASLARQYLLSKPSRRRIDFLRLDREQILARYGGLTGLRIPAPKLIPVNRIRSAARWVQQQEVER